MVYYGLQKNIMKKIIFIILIFILVSKAFSQNIDFYEIEKECRYILNKIEKKEFLLNEYRVNANRFALDEPNYFQVFEKFYYIFDKRERKNNNIVLKAIIIRKEKDRVNYYQEYLFDNQGDLIYYLEQKQAETSLVPQDKLKIYFHKEETLKWFKNENELKDKTEQLEGKTKKIWLDVKKLKQKFKNDIEKMNNLWE
jgi:outer membrane protein assembly factor BamE (lipoprotein component of BamABCDE complex)